MNPKAKFAIIPIDVSCSPSARNNFSPKSELKSLDDGTASSLEHKLTLQQHQQKPVAIADENTLDNLLQLFNSPKSSSTYEVPASPQFHLTSPVLGTFPSSSSPSAILFNPDSCKNGQEVYAKYGLATSLSDVAYDDDEEDVNDSQLNLSSSKFSSSLSSVGASSSDFSFPSSVSAGSTTSTSSSSRKSRCVRVALGGSSYARGSKMSAFTKWYIFPSLFRINYSKNSTLVYFKNQ